MSYAEAKSQHSASMAPLGLSLIFCQWSKIFYSPDFLIFPSFIIFILDRVGRKKPLLFGASSLVVTFSILAAILATNPLNSPHINAAARRYPKSSMNENLFNDNHNRAGIAMIFMTSIFFSLSFGPVSWVLASEVRQ